MWPNELFNPTRRASQPFLTDATWKRGPSMLTSPLGPITWSFIIHFWIGPIYRLHKAFFQSIVYQAQVLVNPRCPFGGLVSCRPLIRISNPIWPFIIAHLCLRPTPLTIYLGLFQRTTFSNRNKWSTWPPRQEPPNPPSLPRPPPQCNLCIKAPLPQLRPTALSPRPPISSLSAPLLHQLLRQRRDLRVATSSSHRSPAT